MEDELLMAWRFKNRFDVTAYLHRNRFFFFNGLCKEMRVNEIGKDEMKKNESNN